MCDEEEVNKDEDGREKGPDSWTGGQSPSWISKARGCNSGNVLVEEQSPKPQN